MHPLGLGRIKVYESIRNPKGMISNTIKITDAPPSGGSIILTLRSKVYFLKHKFRLPSLPCIPFLII